MQLSLLNHIAKYIEWYEEQELFAVIVVTLALMHLSNHFVPEGKKFTFIAVMSKALSIPYLVYLYPSLSIHNIEISIFGLVRVCLLNLFLVAGGKLIVQACALIVDSLSGIRQALMAQVEERRLERERKENEFLEQQNQPPPPLPRSAVLKQGMLEIQEQYELEKGIIDGTEILDNDEKYVALNQCKQRFLQRLDEITQ